VLVGGLLASFNVFATPWIGVVLMGDRVEASSERGGRILSIDVQIGQQVQAQQRLYTLDRSSAQLDVDASAAQLREARASLAASEIAVQRAQAEIRRQQAAPQLFAQMTREAAELDLQTRQADLQAARARVNELSARAAQSSSQLALLDAKAERAGTVVEILRSPGEQLLPGQVVLRLEARGTPPRVRFALPQAAAALLQSGAALRVTDQTGLEAVATLRQLAPQIDAPSGLVFAEAEMHRTDWPTGTAVQVSPAAPEQQP
jgi:multidrug efflux pump subunit AcrA (membrane-fusion protein)